MSGPIKSHHVTIDDVEKVLAAARACNGDGIATLAAMLNEAVELGLVSPPCYFIAYPSGMPVMHEPGEPIQIYPGKCSEPHHRHWKGQTS